LWDVKRICGTNLWPRLLSRDPSSSTKEKSLLITLKLSTSFVGWLEDLGDKLVAQITELGSTKGMEKEKNPFIILKLTRTFVGCLEDLRDKLVAQIAELGSTEGKEKEKKLRDLLGKQSICYLYYTRPWFKIS